MACIDMLNEHYKGMCGSFSPRISFSNDFVLEAEQCSKIDKGGGGGGSSDFEFSVVNTMLTSTTTADELFFKGRLLPLKEDKQQVVQQKMTLRDELCAVHDDDDDDGLLTSKGWKQLLGLRKAPTIAPSPKKTNKNDIVISPFPSTKPLAGNHCGGGRNREM